MLITKNNWSAFAKAMATDNDPTMHSPAAMDRMIQVFGEKFIRIPTPHSKYKARNTCFPVPIPPDQKEHYRQAEERYMDACQQLKKNPASGKFAQLVLDNKYREASEECKAPVFAKLAAQREGEGFAVGIACCFRRPVGMIVRSLVKDYGYSRKDISLVWGGDPLRSSTLTFTDAKEIALAFCRGEKVSGSVMAQVNQLLTETEDQRDARLHDYGEDLGLGSQDAEQRNREINRFQSGRTKFCLFTFAAGGTGLSLHHAEFSNKGKPVTLRPRYGLITPTYSAQDFVQGLGRLHRLFSMSHTQQDIVFFKDSIEDYVMARVSLKLRCLKKVVAARESWQDAIYEAATKEKRELAEAHNAEEQKMEKDEWFKNNPNDDDTASLDDYNDDNDDE